MKTVKRANLPEQLKYNNRTYKIDGKLSSLYSLGKTNNLPKDVIKVEVLNRNLRGKTDLHGRPYSPSIFIFTVFESNNKSL